MKVKRFVFSSSSSVYGDAKTPTPEEHKTNPISPYALNKLIGEQYCKLYSDIYNLDTVCLRYFNVYGNRMNNEGGYKLVFPIFKEQLLNNKPLTINNDGKQRRDFIHVDDIVRADMFGGEKQYGNITIEPFETLADTSKIDLYLNFQPKNKLKTWISTFTEQSSTE